jgi:hypothetical protein
LYQGIERFYPNIVDSKMLKMVGQRIKLDFSDKIKKLLELEAKSRLFQKSRFREAELVLQKQGPYSEIAFRVTRE